MEDVLTDMGHGGAAGVAARGGEAAESVGGFVAKAKQTLRSENAQCSVVTAR